MPAERRHRLLSGDEGAGRAAESCGGVQEPVVFPRLAHRVAHDRRQCAKFRHDGQLRISVFDLQRTDVVVDHSNDRNDLAESQPLLEREFLTAVQHQ